VPVTIYTYADKRADFIPLQKATFDAFVAEDFEFIVYNNGSSPEFVRRIDEVCQDHGLTSIRVEDADHSDPNVACSYPIQWSFHSRIKRDRDISVIIDSDLFLLKRFSFREYTGDHHICAVKQRRGHVRYLWNGLVFLNVPDLPERDLMDWRHGVVEGVGTDVGGFLYSWLRTTSETLRLKNINYSGDISHRYGNMSCLPRELRSRYQDGFDFQIYENAFFHYKRGSNWDKRSSGHHEEKFRLARDLIDGCLGGRYTLPECEYAFKFPEAAGDGGSVMNYWEELDADEPFDPPREPARSGSRTWGTLVRAARHRLS
jgi:hypothetical protein